MRAKSKKNGIVHAVNDVKPKPNRIKARNSDTAETVNEDIVTFSCGKWGRASSVDCVDEDPTCLECIADGKEAVVNAGIAAWANPEASARKVDGQ